MVRPAFYVCHLYELCLEEERKPKREALRLGLIPMCAGDERSASRSGSPSRLVIFEGRSHDEVVQSILWVFVLSISSSSVLIDSDSPGRDRERGRLFRAGSGWSRTHRAISFLRYLYLVFVLPSTLFA